MTAALSNGKVSTGKKGKGTNGTHSSSADSDSGAIRFAIAPYAYSARYPEKQIEIEADVAAALERAKSRLKSSSLLCATGSTYIAGAARRLLLSSAGRKTSGASTKRLSVTVETNEKNGGPSRSTNAQAQSVSSGKVGYKVRRV